MSNEKILLLRAYGAKVVITPTAVEPDDPQSYYKVADRFARETPNAILANQYHNPDNPKTHELTTGPELWEQTDGRLTDVIIGIGTGGTISGVGHYLKSKNPNIQIVGIDIEGSILTEIWENNGRIPKGAYPKTYKVEGIGEDFLPGAMDITVIDAIERAGDRESFLWARQLVKQEGIFAGGSSGSAIAGAIKYCRKLPAGRIPVVILADAGSRYLSKFYDDKWMREFGFLSMEFGEMPLSDLLIAKPNKALHTALVGDTIRKVVSVMHQHSVSQMPVIDAKGDLAGMIEEVDMLSYLLDSNGGHSHDEPIDHLVQNAESTFPADTSLEDAMASLKSGNALVVVDNGKPIGILTKIDVLDFVAGKI
jgi:cystathionine beta-synthase